MIQAALDLRTPGERLRDQGLDDVELSHERWIPLALEAIRNVAARAEEFTSDEVRQEAEALNLPTPKSANAWGAVWRRAAQEGIASMTDRVRKSTREDARAHRCAVWRSGRAV